jgi:hypothetical protein
MKVAVYQSRRSAVTMLRPRPPGSTGTDTASHTRSHNPSLASRTTRQRYQLCRDCHVFSAGGHATLPLPPSGAGAQFPHHGFCLPDRTLPCTGNGDDQRDTPAAQCLHDELHHAHRLQAIHASRYADEPNHLIGKKRRIPLAQKLQPIKRVLGTLRLPSRGRENCSRACRALRPLHPPDGGPPRALCDCRDRTSED